MNRRSAHKWMGAVLLLELSGLRSTVFHMNLNENAVAKIEQMCYKGNRESIWENDDNVAEGYWEDKERLKMPEQKIVEKARKILVEKLGYPDPADCDKYDGNGLVM